MSSSMKNPSSLSMLLLMSALGSRFAHQMQGLPHFQRTGSLYICLTLTHCWPPSQSFHAGKNFKPPLMSSKTAYRADSFELSTSFPLRTPWM